MRRMIFRSLCLTAVLGIAAVQAFADTKSVDQLNELLRGERSAVETYTQALDKVGSDPGAQKLHEALQHHQEAVTDISKEVARLGGRPETDSGAWGAWAKTVTASAKVLGDAAALKALKEGEEHGVKEYREMLKDESVPQDFKRRIESTYLPRQQQHIATLDTMIERAS